VWNWTFVLTDSQADPPSAKASRVAINEQQIEADGVEKWVYALIDTELKLLLGMAYTAAVGAV